MSFPLLSAPRRLALLLSLSAALLGPALAQVGVVSDLMQTFSGTPGAVQQGTLRLKNDGDQPARARLYQTDYLFTANGQPLSDRLGSHPRSNGPWLHLGSEVVTVPPGGTLEVPYTLQVPAGAAGTGTYWSMIMIEPLDADDARAGGTPQGLSIKQVVRYGVQVVTELGTGGKRSLAFQSPVLERDSQGRMGLQVDLLNDGERMVQPTLYVEVYDAAGKLVGRVDGRRERLYPGTGSRQQFVFPALTAGKYQAVVVADGGGENVFGVRYNFDVP